MLQIIINNAKLVLSIWMPFGPDWAACILANLDVIG
jgi:hypothetical protein